MRRFSSWCASKSASRIPSASCSRFSGHQVWDPGRVSHVPAGLRRAKPGFVHAWPALPRPLRRVSRRRELILWRARHVVARDAGRASAEVPFEKSFLKTALVRFAPLPCWSRCCWGSAVSAVRAVCLPCPPAASGGPGQVPASSRASAVAVATVLRSPSWWVWRPSYRARPPAKPPRPSGRPVGDSFRSPIGMYRQGGPHHQREHHPPVHDVQVGDASAGLKCDRYGIF